MVKTVNGRHLFWSTLSECEKWEAACLNTVVVWAYHYVLTNTPIEDRASVLMQRCQNYYTTLAGYSFKTKYGSISVYRYGTGGLTSSPPYLMGNSLTNGQNGQWSAPVLKHAFGASEAACLNTVVVWAYHYVLTYTPIEDRASVWFGATVKIIIHSPDIL
jgi:hypothetical protein